MKCAARNKCKGNWSIYNSVYSATLDRIYRDEIFKDTSQNEEEYIRHLAKTNYWVENGIDAGYSESLKTMVEKNREQTKKWINLILAFGGATAFLILTQII